MSRVLSCLFLLALAACGSTLPPPPRSFSQAVVEAGLAYNAAASAAVTYARQPRCGTPEAKAPPLCADRNVVARMGTSSAAARSALRIAQDLALMPSATPAAQDAALANVTARVTELRAALPTGGN